jgi:hypothetical protein
MIKRYSLTLTSDRTIRVMAGRNREYVGLVDKTKAEIFEQVKWALISKDAWVSDERLTQDLHELIWRHIDG